MCNSSLTVAPDRARGRSQADLQGDGEGQDAGGELDSAQRHGCCLLRDQPRAALGVLLLALLWLLTRRARRGARRRQGIVEPRIEHGHAPVQRALIGDSVRPRALDWLDGQLNAGSSQQARLLPRPLPSARLRGWNPTHWFLRQAALTLEVLRRSGGRARRRRRRSTADQRHDYERPRARGAPRLACPRAPLRLPDSLHVPRPFHPIRVASYHRHVTPSLPHPCAPDLVCCRCTRPGQPRADRRCSMGVVGGDDRRAGAIGRWWWLVSRGVVHELEQRVDELPFGHASRPSRRGRRRRPRRCRRRCRSRRGAPPRGRSRGSP